jgi:transcriptional regulator with XRE-family HTH domain
MRPIFSPSIIRLSGRPRPEPGERAPIPKGAYGKGRPYADGAVETVRRLIEETTLTYHQIAARTGASPASISRWMQAGSWKRPLFAPRSMLTVPTPRATAYNKHRLLSGRLAALAERYVRELEEAPTIDLDKLGQALQLAKMAKLAAMRRTPRRAEAGMWGEPMRPIAELCAAGVDLSRAPRAAVEDFLAHRAEAPEHERPPRSRGRGTARYRTRKQRHEWMLEREE